MSRLTSLLAAIAGPLVLAACAVSPPTGPNVLVVPSEGKDLGRFQQEDAACRAYAQQQLGLGASQQAANQGASAGTLQQRYDVAYVQCMAASGNRLATNAAGEPYLLSSYSYPAYYGFYDYPYYGPYFGGAGISLGFFGHRHFDHFHHRWGGWRGGGWHGGRHGGGGHHR